jgi:hypothetical protein
MAEETIRKIRDVLADSYSFVRSMEANSAFATVTMEELMGDQIKRNGESSRSNASQYTPYSYDPKKKKPASLDPSKRVNFIGGSDTYRPTKLDRILALSNDLVSVIDQVKAMEPSQVAGAKEYTEAAEVSLEVDTSEVSVLYKIGPA